MMNRREFCQTAALFLAGTTCVRASLRSEEQMAPFRAQRIFLDSWDSKNNGKETLEVIHRNGCHAVLLVPGRRTVLSSEVEKIVSEASQFNLNVFVPARLTRDLLGEERTILPLSLEAGILQNIDRKPTGNGGFLLLDEAGEPHGLVLYDSSRCLWTSFAAPGMDCKRNSENGVSGSRLMTAKWLDRILAVQAGDVPN